ncbi:LINE-1 retrotransposable element ORF2 protein [Vitis vinifera]|uniref:LINE-1 retrotransposable element ORF2 protein n=1 Tax=Vitis vinifera TaxID=29760 RepID=A0A438H5M5_VITVI|nr:LINE-1 retrotransposable element ORF2 protein [Vitis vinifera]
MSEEVVRSLGPGRYLDWKALNAMGTAGGVLICWDKRSLELLGVEEGQFSISCRFRNVGDGVIWVFTGVYGPCSRKDRECLWEEFGAIRGLWEDPWCLGGDFNSTLYQAERSRNGRITSAMRRFAQVIDELGLIDIPLQGGSFTWSGGLNNQSWARLDRFLVSPNWIDQYSRANQRRLPRPISDHFPILLEGGGLRRGPYPFKFENMWLKAEGFKELIEGWWQGIVVRGRPSYRLAAKMRGLKHNLKIWNKEVFGRLEKNKAEALQQVERWDVVEEERALSEEELGHKKIAKENYSKWVSMEEVHWRQLSREIWLREGDRNTGFFHRMANAHRRVNNLIKIKINGVRLTEDQEISLSEADALELPFTEAEIYAALMGMNGDKAPGPDGFTVAFWQNCWEIVKEDVLDMFKEFYDQNSFIKSLNHTFLVLIPKKGGAEDLGDYRPISLLGGLYKLLAKVLANRLKKIIDKVISPDQNAFIKGRQILDGSLIANEVIDSWQKRGEKGLIYGLRIKMDRMDVELYFYHQIFNVGEWGSSWFLSSSKGLRQGDPLSPYLFIMGMEVLSVLISRAVEGGFIYGCRIWKGRGQPVNITHLLFADDTIVFCEAKKESLLYLSWILLWFEAASGLKINLEKSMVIPVGEVEGALDMAAEIGCKVGQLPTVYLGLPLGAPNRASSVWDGVEEKMRRKLALWKRNFLSKGGRITLIKSTLASIPLYQMLLFRMPKLVARRLEKLQRNFLWGGANGGNKAHLIKWEVVCTDKKKGGLGLRKLIWLNKALLGKWIWRFARAKEELWKKVLEAKYGKEEFGWRTKKANGVFGVGVWKEILKESTWCWDNMVFKVGKGNKVRFWIDPWCGNNVLSEAFPDLFSMAVQRSATVEDYWDQNLSQGGWSLRLLRDFNDWELGLVDNMLVELRNYRVSMEEDSVFWRGGADGLFKVKEAYRVLVNADEAAFPHSNVWVAKVPTKIIFFAWEATWGRFLHWIDCREEDGTFLIGASCVDVKRKLSIIFLFIVRWQKNPEQVIFTFEILQTAIGGGGGDIGKRINNGGGDGGDDDGDDDDYFDDFDDGDEGDEGGLFRRRLVLEELFDRKFVDAVLNEWQKTMMDLPAGLRQAYEMGLVSSAQMVKFLAINARPTTARFISRTLPQGMSRAFIGR